jgi:hypothetical protein
MKKKIQSGYFRLSKLFCGLYSAVLVISLLSCSQLFDKPESNAGTDSDAACTLSVTLTAGSGGISSVLLTDTAAASARTVFPTFSSGSWKAKIWNGSTEPDSWSSSVSDTVLAFTVASAAAATYTIRLGYFSDTTAAEPVFYTDTTVTVTKGQADADCTVSILPDDCTAGSTTSYGRISLGLTNSSTSIDSLSVSLFDTSGTRETGISLGDGVISAASLEKGIYTLNVYGLDSDGTTIYRYPSETLYVWPGLTTDTWYPGDGSTSSSLDITEASYTAAETVTFCVASGGSDTDGDGGFANPFATVQHAVDCCTASGTVYTIYINGAVTVSETVSVTDDKEIILTGLNGSDTDRLDGGHTSGGSDGCQILNIESGSSVTVENLTLQNGYASGGGGIYNAGTFTVDSGTISDCMAASGGGIYNTGTLTVNGGTIGDCTATSGGGGIYNTGTLTVNGGTISSCTAATGGGICNTGTLTMSGGMIGDCTAATGGGVCNTGTLAMSGGTISSCTAASDGGGVYDNGSFSINGSAVVDAGSNDIYLTAGTTLSIAGTLTPEDNDAAGNPSVCAEITLPSYAADTTVLELDSGVTETTLADEAGRFTLSTTDYFISTGGTLVSALLTASDITPTSFVSYFDSIPEGNTVTLDLTETCNVSGADTITIGENKNIILKSSSDVTLTNGAGTLFDIAGGSLTLGGGDGTVTIAAGLTTGNPALLLESGSLTITDGGAVTTNSTMTGSCGVSVTGGTFTMSGGTISGCLSSGLTVSGGTISVTGGSITGNGTGSYAASAVLLSGGAGSISGLTVSGNTANRYGGGIKITGGTYTFSDCSIEDNAVTASSATTAYGGGIYIDMADSADTVSFTDCTVTGNTVTTNSAEAYGGGIAVQQGTVTYSETLSGNTATANSSTAWGQQMYCSADGTYNGSSGTTID